MATEQFMPQYINWNNLEEVWAQIKNNFIAAAPAAKGDMIYWSAQPTAGQNANPAASIAHLTIPVSNPDKCVLSVANGIPAWKVLSLTNTPDTSKLTLGVSLAGSSVSSVDILEATASRAGVVTTLEQTLHGDKHLQGNFDASGVAVKGIADLDMAQTGGGGTVTGIIIGSGDPYTPPEGSTIITLPNYPVIPQTYDLANITSADDLKVIETLSGTGYLQRTGNNEWALRSVSDMRTFLGIGTPDAAGGVPLLDTGSNNYGKIKLSQLPDVILGQLVFGGTVNASGVATLSTNAKAKTGITSDTVTLSNSAGTSSSYGWVRFEGIFFIMDADSSFASLDLKVGDWLLSTGTAWKKVDNTDAVTSVNGQIGAVTLTAANVGAVDKTGDTMSGKLTISAGGLEVTGESKFNSGITLANAQKLVSVYSGSNYDLVYCDSSGNILFGNSSRPTIVSGSSLSFKVGTTQILGLSSTGASVTGTLGVSGATTLSSTLGVTGATTLSSSLSVGTTLGVTGATTLGGAATINNTLAVNGTSTLQDIEAKTDNSYSIGNSTKFFASLFANKLIGKTSIGMYIGNTSTKRAELDNTGLSVFGGVAAQGITDLDMAATGGAGTVTGVSYKTNVAYATDTVYEPAEGSTIINLPALTWGNVTGKPTFAAVATSGSYNDLENKPSLNFLPLSGGSSNAMTGVLYITPATSTPLVLSGNNTESWIQFRTNGGTDLGYIGANTTLGLRYYANNNSYKIWHAGNDGTGSGLDADLIDGHHYADLVTAVGVSGDTLTWSKGGTAQTALTIPYATKALQMKQETKTNQEFTYRKSPKTIDADSLVINKFKGRTLVWNQLCPNSYSAEYSQALDGSRSQQIIRTISSPVTKDHIFYVAYSAKANASVTGNFALTDSLGGKDNVSLTVNYQRISHIRTITRSSSPSVSVGVKFTPSTASSATITTKDFVSIDLTLMFGAGNEPSTVEEFEALYPGYHSYNAGQLINNSAEGLETVGFNLFDDTTLIMGLYRDDNNNESSIYETRRASLEYFPCLPNKTYYAYHDGSGTGSFVNIVCFYDSNKQFISGVHNSAGSTFISPSNAAYMRLSSADPDGHLGVNLSDPNRNGQYEPYKRNVLDLHLDNIQVKSHNIWDEEWESGTIGTDGQPASNNNQIRSKNFIKVVGGATYYVYGAIQVHQYKEDKSYIDNRTFVTNGTITLSADARYIKFRSGDNVTTYSNNICINESSSFNGKYEPHGILTIHGLKQAGSVYDEIVGNKLVKRVGVQDLGLCNWTYNSGYTIPNFNTQLPLAKIRTYGTAGDNLVSPKYIGISDVSYNSVPYGRMKMDSGNISFFVADSAYTSAATFKTAMSGVMLNYELATPIEYELVSPIPTTMPAGTTERIISDRLPVTPFPCDMTYGTNSGDILKDVTGLSSRLDFNLSQMTVSHYKSAQDSVVDSHLITLRNGQQMYLKFNASTQGKFDLAMASDDDDTNLQSFSFGTMTAAQIQAICHL